MSGLCRSADSATDSAADRHTVELRVRWRLSEATDWVLTMTPSNCRSTFDESNLTSVDTRSETICPEMPLLSNFDATGMCDAA